MLLYRFERLQLDQYFQERGDEDARAPSQVYGAEHLLRLMVRLPKLVSLVGLSDKEAREMEASLVNFVSWLHEERTRLFTSDYMRATDAYASQSDKTAEASKAPWEL